MKNLVTLISLALTCEGRIHRSQTLRAHSFGHTLASDSRSNHSRSLVHSEALNKKGSQGAQRTVCPFGDSLTDGLQGHDDVYVNLGGFRPALEQNLEAEGAELLGFRKCPCHAYPTASSFQLLQQVRKSGYKCGSEHGAARYPDIALVLIGTNDLYKSIQVDQSMKWVKVLLTELWERTPTTQALVASVPVHPANPQPFHSYNRALRDLVVELQSAGQNIEYVAMQEKTGLCTADTCHYDHIHPNAKGYSLMADVWWGAIKPKLGESLGPQLDDKKVKAMPERSSAYCSGGGVALAVVAFTVALWNLAGQQ